LPGILKSTAANKERHSRALSLQPQLKNLRGRLAS